MINSCKTFVMEKLCRSCMCESTDTINMFESKKALGDQSHLIADMFMACASVEITAGDALPKIICTQCELKLSVAFEFKKQSEKTDTSLRKLVTPVGDEEIEIKPDVNDYYDDNDNGNVSDSDESNTSKSDRDSFHCKYCSKRFRSKNGFKLHMQKHNNEKLHSCHICQQKFSKSKLHKHLQNVHKTDAECNTHTCDECGLSFSRAYLLSKHMKEHKMLVKDKAGDDDSVDASKYSKDETTDADLQSKSDMNKYECKFCSKSLASCVGLKIHMRRHTGKNLHICTVCKKTFTKSNHLKRHMLTHGVTVEVKKTLERTDKDKKIMQCEFCDRKFKYKKSFNHHMLSEHGISDDSDAPLSALIEKKDEIKNEDVATRKETESNEAAETKIKVDANIDSIPDSDFLLMTKTTRCYVCYVCGAQFVRSNHLTRHMTFHKALLIHKCDRCDKAFTTEEILTKHTQEDHINKPYTCTICDKTYSRGEHLIRHLKIHSNPTEINIKCSICEKEFTRSDQLARHIKLHVQQDKRHVCGECGKAFNRLDNLKTHERIHNGTKDNAKLHLCIYCGKEFNNSSNMIVHMRRHTGERPYKCSQCSKGFPRSHDLKCHERTHSGEKPYMCTLCGKAFNKSNKLLRHTRVHTGERPYACNLCGRAFTQSNDLALHMRRHTGARPYACGMCPARFIQSGQLKAHRRSTGHWMETQPDLKGGHRVEPVVPLSDPAPIRFKTHGKKKLEEEFREPEGKESQITSEPVNIIVQPMDVDDTKIVQYPTGEIVAYDATRENVAVLHTHDVKNEIQNNCASNNINSDSHKEHMNQQNYPNTFQIYNTNAPTSTAYSYTTYHQSFG